MKSIYIYPLLVISILLITSCEYEIIEPIKYPVSAEDTVSFENDIIPILDNYCINCHNPGGGASFLSLESPGAYDVINNSTYINTADPDNSLFYTKLSSGHLDNASPEDYHKILMWITDGAENN